MVIVIPIVLWTLYCVDRICAKQFLGGVFPTLPVIPTTVYQTFQYFSQRFQGLYRVIHNNYRTSIRHGTGDFEKTTAAAPSQRHFLYNHGHHFFHPGLRRICFLFPKTRAVNFLIIKIGISGKCSLYPF